MTWTTLLACSSAEHAIELSGQVVVLAAGLATLWLGLGSLSPALKDPSRTTSPRDASVRIARLVPGFLVAIAGLWLIFLAARAILNGHDSNGLLQFIRNACLA